MKKTLKLVGIIAVLIMTLVTLTGCMNVNFDVQLDKNGSGDVSYIIGYKKSFVESIGMTIDQLKENDTSLEEKQEAGEAEGYTVEEYEDDNTYGIIAKKHYDNIEEFSISKELDLEVEEGLDKITFTKEGSKAKYLQDAKIDLTDLLGDEEDEEDSQMAMMTAMFKQMEMTYRITLPFKAGENNATTVSEDGKTLEWKLTFGEVNEIKFEAEENSSSTVLYILIGVCILLVIAAIIGAAINSKGKGKTEPATEKEPEVAKEEPVVEEVKNEVEDIKEEVEEKVEEVKEVVEDIKEEAEDIKEETEGNKEE